MLLWVMELLSADVWVTPAPMNGPPNDAPTSPPLPPSSRVASPSPALEANIKQDAPVKFEVQPEGKEKDGVLWIKFKRDPDPEEDKQMYGLRDLEHGAIQKSNNMQNDGSLMRHPCCLECANAMRSPHMSNKKVKTHIHFIILLVAASLTGQLDQWKCVNGEV
ncbi:hypothetical protein EDD18DRAFT_1353059 [Armillaria luteobubalina]|uniref:Uncharacterized protein n=1 Tax=Armillaria luteobubalina TaxID=153913 RepID=A0AA39Q547_9AGAR|nr:hypothetical protein EDD18DRAFT_1353059 [Armillaria luteobubalina]